MISQHIYLTNSPNFTLNQPIQYKYSHIKKSKIQKILKSQL